MNIEHWLNSSWLIGSRYFITAGIAFLIFYVLFKKLLASKRIQQKTPSRKDYQREIGYSILTILIFGVFITLLLRTPQITQHTTFYSNISDYGIVYFWLAFPLMAVMHDTYFYWTHRLMHHPKLFRLFHLVHHKSTNPSPWAAYSFHPLEAIVEAGILVIFLFTIPVHLLHIGLFFLFMIVYNVYGHLGFELYPKWVNQTILGKWVNTSISHNMHHQYFKGNYGLYFTFWDRAMGTLHPEYETTFLKITSKAKTKLPF